MEHLFMDSHRTSLYDLFEIRIQLKISLKFTILFSEKNTIIEKRFC